MITNLVMTSGGATSWEAARRVKERYGLDGLVMLFSDTRMEDEDLYRFLIESCAHISGVPVPECAYWEIPTIESERLAERKAILVRMQEATNAAIPHLRWIADGRTPWEVFTDERFIGNSRVDPCSKVLKRELMDSWRAKHCDVKTTRVYVGLDWTEMHRVKRYMKRIKPWKAAAPLLWKPWTQKPSILLQLASLGIKAPRLYAAGFAHNNCGGFCCKAGQGAALNLLKKFPERFTYHETQEAILMDRLDTPCTMLTDRRGGGKSRSPTTSCASAPRLTRTPLTLRKSVDAGALLNRC